MFSVEKKWLPKETQKHSRTVQVPQFTYWVEEPEYWKLKSDIDIQRWFSTAYFVHFWAWLLLLFSPHLTRWTGQGLQRQQKRLVEERNTKIFFVWLLINISLIRSLGARRSSRPQRGRFWKCRGWDEETSARALGHVYSWSRSSLWLYVFVFIHSYAIIHNIMCTLGLPILLWRLIKIEISQRLVFSSLRKFYLTPDDDVKKTIIRSMFER